MAQDGFSRSRDSDDDCAICPDKTENIIVIGSEFEYNDAGFWLKCMFLACGFAVGQGRIPPPGWTMADRTTVLYVPLGYNRWERLTLDWLRDNAGVAIERITSKSSFISYLRQRQIDGDTHKIRNLVIFSHGLPGYFSLNYAGPGNNMNVYASDLTALPSDIFTPDGRLFSYACRTAAGTLGQTLADHFDITVRAFSRRSFYGNVMRQRSNSAALASALRSARATREGERIDLPPDHEAFPHPRLGSGMFGMWGGSAEGTNDYALWRKAGAISLPEVGDTPANQPGGYATLTPRTT